MSSFVCRKGCLLNYYHKKIRRFLGNWKTCILHCPFLGFISYTSPFRYKVPYYNLHFAAKYSIYGWFTILRPGLSFIIISNYFPYIDLFETNATISPIDSGFKRLIYVIRLRSDDHLPLYTACVFIYLDLTLVLALPR
jgi:hypothetical protein